MKYIRCFLKADNLKHFSLGNKFYVFRHKRKQLKIISMTNSPEVPLASSQYSIFLYSQIILNFM